MAARKLNVLVYTGTGTTSESVRHCIFTLRQLLSPNYAVIPINESVILKEPWAPTCALLVIPGGADLGYCRVLNGEGNRRISDYVRRGGSFLGFCAGSYYGCRRCEFEVGNKGMEVIGSRELGFFPGTCRGGAFKGFEYRGEGGARAVKLRTEPQLLGGEVPDQVVSYFNGGGVFVDAKTVGGNKVEVLASYDEDIDVDGGDGKAAIIFSKFGNGRVVLSGPHPEFSPANLSPHPNVPNYDKLIESIGAADAARMSLLRGLFTKLGLEPVQGGGGLPALSSLHLTSINNSEVSELLSSWNSIIEKEDGQEFIRGEVDTFRIRSDDTSLDMSELKSSLPTTHGNHFVDYSKVIKELVCHENSLPSVSETPQFDHKLYYSSLKKYQLLEGKPEGWGSILMYGEVLTSTNSIVEKNPKLLEQLPTGFTVAATTQVAARGRGTNVFIAPPGCLIFSTIINHPGHLSMSHPIVFFQYLAAIATVEAIQSYDEGYEAMPVKLKWPNDIYALDPTSPKNKPTYTKIGGILSQCAYFNGNYQTVLGVGVNTTNRKPTISLADLLPPGVAPLRIETLLARFLTTFESLHAQFLRQGFSADLEKRYYKHWLHTGQEVTLEAEGGVRARVLGITRDWGMLRVEEIDMHGRGTGKLWALQSDENSFDYWKGLLRKKL